MNEERTGKCLWQVEHIRGHLWHRYPITVNQVMVATVKLSKWWLQLNQSQVTLSSAASLLAATLYIGNHDRNHKLWNIGSIQRCILHMQALLKCCYIKMESSQCEHWNHVFCHKVSFLTTPHCQFRCVGQGMKQTYLCLWYPLFQAQWIWFLIFCVLAPLSTIFQLYHGDQF